MSDIPMQDYKVEAYGTVVNPPGFDEAKAAEENEKGDEE